LIFGRQKLNLHVAGQVVDPNVRHATPGSADICLLTETPMAEILAHLAASGVAVIEGPVRRTGATGSIESVYIYDPDENLLEIAHPAGN
jgi:catechol 2,3-dioxygenase-like lactoylglutathione lyase family enzyme